TCNDANMQREEPLMSLGTPGRAAETLRAAALDASRPFAALAAGPLGRVIPAGDLNQRRSPPPIWLWQGYLSPGKVTLLTSQWKSGKTTLVSLLLARMQQGGQLAGLPGAS